MNRKIFTITIASGIICMLACSSNKLVNLADNEINVVNRQVSSIDKTSNTITLNDKEGAGLAVLNNVSFNTGTLLFDIKGENKPGRSFVGIAFNIEDDSTYEAIYFRPFNFESSEQIRREHCIQYVYEPVYPWNRLRSENEGEFEAEYFNPPSPDDWFSVSVTVESNKVIVKDANSGKILMQTKRLSSASSDKIGFWVGNNSKGSFRNMRVQ